MNKKELLKMLGVKILEEGMPVYTSDRIECIGYLNGFFIFSCGGCWIVNGKMPFMYAQELYEYRDLEIRIAGSNNKPEDWCTNEDFLKAKEEISQRYDLDIIDFKESSKELADAKEKYIKSNLENCYVESYHIDTIQGLKKVVEVIKENNIRTEW